MDQALIDQELERRSLLSKAIDSIIDRYFVFRDGHRLKRGGVQIMILKRLNIVRTGEICRLINERMAANGFRPYIAKGELLYQNISLKICK